MKKRMVKAAAYTVAFAVLGIPALFVWFGEWISEWKWPNRFKEILEDWADKHGVRL